VKQRRPGAVGCQRLGAPVRLAGRASSEVIQFEGVACSLGIDERTQ
jgi:hypothetical protein